MVDTGTQKGQHNIVTQGFPPILTHHKVETATNMYPGRLVKKGTTAFDIVVNDGITRPKGWLAFENTAADFKPLDKTTIYNINDMAGVIRGGGFIVEATLAAGCLLPMDGFVGNWSNGQVVGPVMPSNGGFWLGVPFVQHATEYDTLLDLPTGVAVRNAVVEVTTQQGASTIDFGIGMGTEAGYDADGFVDGQPCTAAGLGTLNLADGTAGNITLGVLLQEIQLKDANSVYVQVLKNAGYICDGTCKSLCYTTSAHAIVGRVWLEILHPGLTVVGQAELALDATAAAGTTLVRSFI